MISDVVVQIPRTKAIELSDERVYFMNLRCGGGGTKGETGASCDRVAAKERWCTGPGLCAGACGWTLQTSKEQTHTQLQHMPGQRSRVNFTTKRGFDSNCKSGAFYTEPQKLLVQKNLIFKEDIIVLIANFTPRCSVRVQIVVLASQVCCVRCAVCCVCVHARALACHHAHSR